MLSDNRFRENQTGSGAAAGRAPAGLNPKSRRGTATGRSARAADLQAQEERLNLLAIVWICMYITCQRISEVFPVS